jgi:CRP-like cAMP-binding protein
MKPNLLLSNIRSFVPITEEEWLFISAQGVERSFKKGQFINKAGEINRFTNFIESGSARVFHIDSDGNEKVLQLGIAGWWISDFASFIAQKEGLLFTEALETTSVISFSYESIQLIYKEVPLFERFYRLLVQRAYVSFQYRMLHNLSMDAEQRYINFSQTYPDMDQQVSQKHIASYLGMSAEFLSKVKKRIYQKRKSRGDTSTTSF